MPPKRKPALFKKENQLLVTRLMKISLEVDKHVYKNQHISVKSARGYIAELVQLSSSRGQDARTKQVIEKLTRQMKSVIAEHENTFIPSQDITELPSDVSLASTADNTYTKQAQIDGDSSPINNITDKDINTVNVGNPNVTIQETASNKCDEIQVTDVVQNSEVPIFFESQSILSNTATATDRNSQYEEKTGSKDVIHDKLVPKTNKVKPKFLPPTKMMKVEHNKTNLATLPLSNKTNVTFDINAQDILGDEIDNNDINITDNSQKAKTPKQDIIKPTKKKDIKETSKVTKITKSTTVNNAPKKRNTKNKNANHCSPPSITETVNERQTVIENNNNVNLSNNNVEPAVIQEDLSWIENIKYVREIAVDELIPTATTKSFWENLSFAGQINTQDFL